MKTEDLKFRTWDKTHGMLNVDAIDFNNKMVSLVCNCGRIHTYYKSIDLVHLMQYTGIKDKNGKDLYEGDIVRTHGFYTHEIKIPNVYNMSYNGGIYNYSDHSNGCEIIGNIYENSDLIGEVF